MHKIFPNINNEKFALYFVFVLIFSLALGCKLRDSGSNGIDTNTNEGTPKIKSISANRGKAGDEIIIEGNFFGTTQGSGYVLFNTTRVKSGEYKNWSNLKIKVLVPHNATDGPVKVVTSKNISTNTINFKVDYPPIITSFSPNTVFSVFDTVTISGKYFGSSINDLSGYLKIDTTNIPNSYIGKWADSTIKFFVPNGTNSGYIHVHTSLGMDSTTAQLTINNRPIISAVSNNPVYVGQTFSIFGSNFLNLKTVNEYISINNTKFLSNNIYYWSDTEIAFIMPQDISSGDLFVHTYAGDSEKINLVIKESNWITENVNSIGNISDTESYIDAVYDSVANRFHVTYCDNYSGLAYANKSITDSTWNNNTIDSNGLVSNIILNNNGNPNIIYYSKTNAMKFARKSLSNWETSTIDATGGSLKLTHSSINSEVDTSGIIHTVYNINNLNNKQIVKYIKIDSTGILSDTTITFLDNEYNVNNTQVALALKKDNLPFIAVAIGYNSSAGSPNKMNFYDKIPTGWNSIPSLEKKYIDPYYVDTTAPYGGISIRKDTQDNKMHIAFVDGPISINPIDSEATANSGGIFYSIYSPEQISFINWKNIYSDNNFSNSWSKRLDLKVDKAKNLQILFTKKSTSQFEIYKLKNVNTSWETESGIVNSIDSPYSNFVFDKNGLIHIFYYNNGYLKHYYNNEITK
ncbi:IPT/TIG domain-containing protein [Candidatus Poribacteria bacterium]|nr:IPT/TIG domain-containing protein [Candidatus Poribacteria bacterium]